MINAKSILQLAPVIAVALSFEGRCYADVICERHALQWHDGQKVTVLGLYKETSSQPRTGAVVLLSDGTKVSLATHLRQTPTRPLTEPDQFDGKKVLVAGRAHAAPSGATGPLSASITDIDTLSLSHDYESYRCEAAPQTKGLAPLHGRTISISLPDVMCQFFGMQRDCPKSAADGPAKGASADVLLNGSFIGDISAALYAAGADEVELGETVVVPEITVRAERNSGADGDRGVVVLHASLTVKRNSRGHGTADLLEVDRTLKIPMADSQKTTFSRLNDAQRLLADELIQRLGRAAGVPSVPRVQP